MGAALVIGVRLGHAPRRLRPAEPHSRRREHMRKHVVAPMASLVQTSLAVAALCEMGEVEARADHLGERAHVGPRHNPQVVGHAVEAVPGAWLTFGSGADPIAVAVTSPRSDRREQPHVIPGDDEELEGERGGQVLFERLHDPVGLVTNPRERRERRKLRGSDGSDKPRDGRARVVQRRGVRTARAPVVDREEYLDRAASFCQRLHDVGQLRCEGELLELHAARIASPPVRLAAEQHGVSISCRGRWQS